MKAGPRTTVNPTEIEHFTKDSGRWWDEDGPFAPLHRLNPARLSYIKRQICDRFDRNYADAKALRGLDMLDIGCGGGLVCEPLARMGAKVTGIDADSKAIDTAQAHAQISGLTIDYRACAAEEMKGAFDTVLAMEIIEHVINPDAFVAECARLLKPGGLLILSTPNRTPESFLLGIVAAEYVLGWVPRGTHNWRQFIKPSELSRILRQQNLTPRHIAGLRYNPLERSFSLAPDNPRVNYLISAEKPLGKTQQAI